MCIALLPHFPPKTSNMTPQEHELVASAHGFASATSTARASPTPRGGSSIHSCSTEGVQMTEEVRSIIGNDSHTFPPLEASTERPIAALPAADRGREAYLFLVSAYVVCKSYIIDLST